MSLFSAAEYAVVTIDPTGRLRAGRIRRKKKKMLVVRVLELAPDDREPAERLNDVLRQLDLRNDQILLLCAAPAGGIYFETRSAAMPHRELESSLLFEVQQQLLQPPADCRIQYVARPLPDGELRVGVWAFPAGALHDLENALRRYRRRADAFLYPMLTLPKLPDGEKIRLPELDPDFYWQDGSWHPVPPRPLEYNTALEKLLKAEFTFDSRCGDDEAALFRNYLTVLLAARFASRPDFARQRAGLSVLPPALRPQRLRTQLQLGTLLLLALLGCWSASGVSRVLAFRSEYMKIKNQTESFKQRSTKLRAKMRSRDKELKEMTKIVELNIGDHAMLSNFARLSEALPQQMLVSNLRWSDTGIDLTIQTSMEDPDLVGPLRKLPEYKVSNLQHRQLNDTLTMISLKLANQQTEASK